MDHPDNVLIRPATSTDVDGITNCVNAAYAHFVHRMGNLPGPLLDDYKGAVSERQTFVAIKRKDGVGVLVLVRLQDAMLLENVAVHPSAQERGLGGKLMALAEQESRKQGYSDIQLYTHVKMTENIAMYLKMGWTETSRRSVDGFDRVHMSKAQTPTTI